MAPSRRELLAAGLAAVVTPAVARGREPAANPLGLVIHSFPVRASGDRDRRAEDRLANPSRFLEHARTLGARGIQVAIGTLDDTRADALRARAEAASMTIEGIIACPRDEDDAARFEAEVRAARRAGATIARTALLSGRRYEAFRSLAAFREFVDRSVHSLRLAAPIVARHGLQLAVENHKDLRADELLAMLGMIGPDHIGTCVDTGNSLALLEDPMETVEALAPRAITSHIKDIGVEECPQGFRIAEVPLGAGVLDIPRMVRTLRAAHPDVPLNLEMITRDPLEVPCLGEVYWATFPDLPARHLARTLAFVRSNPIAPPLPRVSQLASEARLQAEDENIARCLVYAREHL